MEGSLGRGREKNTNTWRPPKGRVGTGPLGGQEEGRSSVWVLRPRVGGGRASAPGLWGEGRGCGVEMEARGWPIGESRARTPQGYRGVPVLTWSLLGAAGQGEGPKLDVTPLPQEGRPHWRWVQGAGLTSWPCLPSHPPGPSRAPHRASPSPQGAQWTLAEHVLRDEQPHLSSPPPGHQWH